MVNAHECIKYIKEKRKRGVSEGGEGKEITIIKNNLGVHHTEKEEGI